MKSTELRDETVGRQSPHAYDIFLSYSRKDRDFAVRLEKALESYRFPRSLKYAKRNLNVFRDESDMMASDDYHRTIERELVGSAKLAVICSPDARKSKYVEDEIRRFIQHRGDQDIIPVLVRGKANNDTTDESEMAFPEVMCQNRMPLAANFLGCDAFKGKLHKGPFRSSFYSLLAAIHGIDRRRLEQIDERARARRRALTLSTASMIILFLSVALVVAVISQRKAVAATERATRSAKAEEKAKNEALASAEAEKKAKDKAVASAAAEKKAKDEAVAAAAAEKKAKDEALAAAKAEEKAKNEAIAQRNAAESLLYVSDMNLAQRAYDSGDMTRVRELLNTGLERAASPVSPAPKDLRDFHWYYLWHNSYPVAITLKDQPSVQSPAHRSLAFSPNRKILATDGNWAKVELWNLESGQLTAELKLDESDNYSQVYVKSLAFSPAGTLATVASDGTLTVWDIDKRQRLAVFKTSTKSPDALDESNKAVEVAAFSPDGKTLVGGNGDSSITFWEAGTWKELGRFGKGKMYTGIESLAFLFDGQILAAGTNRGTILLWDTNKREVIATLNHGSDDALSVSFSPDGKWLASGGRDETVKLWDVKARSEIAALKNVGGGPAIVTFSPDSKTLATGTYHMTKLWDVDSRRELATLGKGMSVAFSPDGSTLAGANETVTIWDIRNRGENATFEGFAASVASIALSRDNTMLAIAYHDKTISVRDVRTGKELGVLNLPEVGKFVAFSPDGKTLAAAQVDATVRLWEVGTWRELAPLKGHGWSVTSLVFFNDGKLLATGSVDNTVKLWDLGSGRDVATLGTPFQRQQGDPIGALGNIVRAVTLSPKGDKLASATQHGTVDLWDVKSRKKVTTFKGNQRSFTSVAFSADGKTLAAGSDDETIRLWDTRTFHQITQLKGHAGTVNTVAFSENSDTLASGGSDNTIRLWDTRTWKELATLKGHSESVIAVYFSRDQKKQAMLASASEKAIRLWIATRKEELAAQEKR